MGDDLPAFKGKGPRSHGRGAHHHPQPDCECIYGGRSYASQSNPRAKRKSPRRSQLQVCQSHSITHLRNRMLCRSSPQERKKRRKRLDGRRPRSPWYWNNSSNTLLSSEFIKTCSHAHPQRKLLRSMEPQPLSGSRNPTRIVSATRRSKATTQRCRCRVRYGCQCRKASGARNLGTQPWPPASRD